MSILHLVQQTIGQTFGPRIPKEDAPRAIQTTFGRLTSSFLGDENEMFEVYVGKVNYLDYDHETFPDGNTFIPFLHKRSSF